MGCAAVTPTASLQRTLPARRNAAYWALVLPHPDTSPPCAQACVDATSCGVAIPIEGAGGTNAPPAGPSGVCAASAARPGASRDSVQAVVLPGRHRRPVTSSMTQLNGPVAYPSPPPCGIDHDESFCLIAPPVDAHPRTPVKAPPRSRRKRVRLPNRRSRSCHFLSIVRSSDSPRSHLARPLDQLPDADEDGSQLVPLQPEGLAFLAEVGDVSSELIDLQCHRGQAAL